MNAARIRLLIIIGIVTILLGGGAWFAYDRLVFHIASVDPRGTLPTSQNTITIRYNMPLATSDITNHIRFSNNLPFIATVKDSSLIIHLQQVPANNSTFSLHLTNITANNGQKQSSTWNYRVSYVDPNRLSPEEQQRQLDESDSFETNYPLTKKLPYHTDEYDINYDFPNSNTTRMPITITSLLVNTNDPLAAPDSPANLNLLRQARRAAIAWLNDNGYTSEKYVLHFTEPYITNEFSDENNPAPIESPEY